MENLLTKISEKTEEIRKIEDIRNTLLSAAIKYFQESEIRKHAKLISICRAINAYLEDPLHLSLCNSYIEAWKKQGMDGKEVQNWIRYGDGKAAFFIGCITKGRDYIENLKNPGQFN